MSRVWRTRLVALLVALSVCWWWPAPPSRAADERLTNLAHLDFLLDEVTPPGEPGHTTYRFRTEPTVLMPWTYADARPGGTFERIGGGTKDAVTGDYGQGAFNTDDIARAAVVYLRAWRQTGDPDSRAKAYELLRATAYMQTVRGRDAGNFVLWMQPDGDLNPSAEPVELPDPSDSEASYWLARGIWAYGEGYAAFRRSDPAFAAFLQSRMELAVRALDRQVLNRYGRYRVADGRRVPAWLIVNGADASAEAVLGLSAYVAASGDRGARRALSRLGEGIAELGTGRESWPYGAILPWAESRSVWHAWASQMSAALARASVTLDRPRLLGPAVTETMSLDPTLLTSGGPDNGWNPTPSDRTQIAYGVDSRVQSLLAVADVTGSRGARELAGMTASWYFGTNASGTPTYDPDTGVTYDGVAPDGTVNRNSGAESTIHGLLSMLALDAHPGVRRLATGLTEVQSRSGLRTVEAEAAEATTGTVVTPAEAWTGEAAWSGGAYLRLTTGQRATLALPADRPRSWAEPVVLSPERSRVTSGWRTDTRALGVLDHRAGRQGITAAPGVLLPELLDRPVPRAADELRFRSVAGRVDVDAVLLRPWHGRAVLTGATNRAELVSSTAPSSGRVSVGAAGRSGVVRVYDRAGRLVEQLRVRGVASVTLPVGGFAVLRGE